MLHTDQSNAVTADSKPARSDIENELVRLLRANPEVREDVRPGTHLVADLGLESVQVIEYLCEVEDRYDLVIDEDSLADVHTVSDLAAVVERLVSA